MTASAASATLSALSIAVKRSRHWNSRSLAALARTSAGLQLWTSEYPSLQLAAGGKRPVGPRVQVPRASSQIGLLEWEHLQLALVQQETAPAQLLPVCEDFLAELRRGGRGSCSEDQCNQLLLGTCQQSTSPQLG